MTTYLLSGSTASTRGQCDQSVFTDCMPQQGNEAALEAALVVAGALLSNKSYPLRPTGLAAAVFTLPAAPALNDAILVNWVQGVTPIQVTGGTPVATVLDLPAPTGDGAALLVWRGDKWVVSRTTTAQAYACPGDQKL